VYSTIRGNRRHDLLEKIYHLGYAVENIEAATRFYEEHFGARVGEPEEVEEQGIVATMFEVGESMIELVQPTRPDSPVGKFLDKRGEGFHHVAFQVDDLEAALRELKENGVELIDEEPRIGAGGTRMAFLHPRGAHGVLTELVEVPQKIQG
jgi:methylmalonyl-CoA/ethylmalonyl-CoA epimerase